MSKDQYDDVDDEGWPITHAFKSMGLDEILSVRDERQPFAIEGLAREAATTVFLADPRVNVRYFALHLALIGASGGSLKPFGSGAGVPTLLFVPDGDALADSKVVSALLARTYSRAERDRAVQNFRWCHGAADGKLLPQLNESDGHKELKRMLPAGCKLLVLVNPGRYLAEAPNSMNSARFDSLLAKLNKQGIAVVLIEAAARASSASSAYLTNNHDVIRLSLDPAAPVDFGEGFAVTRPKHMTPGLPSTVYLWYKHAEDGTVDVGWDGGVEERGEMGKQVEIWERQQRITRILADCEARGLKKVSQRTIAQQLAVDPATVTRDLRAMRSRLKRQESFRAGSPKDE